MMAPAVGRADADAGPKHPWFVGARTLAGMGYDGRIGDFASGTTFAGVQGGRLLGRWELSLEISVGGVHPIGGGVAESSEGAIQGALGGARRLRLGPRVDFPIRARVGFHRFFADAIKFTQIDTGVLLGLSTGFLFRLSDRLELEVPAPEITAVLESEYTAVWVTTGLRFNVRL